MNVLKATLDTRHQNSVIGNVTQFDNATLELQVVTDGVIDEAWKFPEFELIAMKRDMNPVREVDQDRFTILSKEDHKVQIELKEQFLTCRGTVKMQLVVKDGSRLSTTLFRLIIGQSLDHDVIESHRDVAVLDELEAYVKQGFDDLAYQEQRMVAVEQSTNDLNETMNANEEERNAAEAKRSKTFETNEANRTQTFNNQIEEQSIAFSNAQSQRDESFSESEQNMSQAFETSQRERESAFNKAQELNQTTFTNNETKRQTAFNQSQTANQQDFVDNEAERQRLFETNEASRQKSESQRVKNESERVFAETKRADAEVIRQQKMTEFEEKATQLSEDLDSQVARVDEFVSENEEKLLGPYDKTDYMGNAHKSVKDANDANVEYILGEVNTVHYEGQHITATDTIEKQVRSAILKGRTLVNLANTSNLSFDAAWGGKIVESVTLTGGKQYLVSLQLNADEPELTLQSRQDFSFISHLKKGFAKGDNQVIVTLDSTANGIRFQVGSSFDALIANIMIIEYQTGMENWDIPYFEGMSSVKMPVLKTTGKNLFDMNRPYDAITDNQATVVQDTNKITVSSANSGIYVNANFILDKDFFAGKTVTGSCLYESDIEDIGTVQISYQDGNGDHHYQWIKTPKTFTFPNNFIGDVMLCVSANNTGTPQSNTVTVKNIQLELGSTATSYEPHKSNILTVNEEVELRGIGDVQDTLNLMTGELTQRIGEVTFDGSENWSKHTISTDEYFVGIIWSPMADVKGGSNTVSDKLTHKFSTNDDSVIYFSAQYPLITFHKDSLESMSIESFKKKLSELSPTVQYQLAQESVKTVDLSDNHVYSYKDVTHYDCSSAEGSLVPTLSIDVPTNLPAVVARQRVTIQELEKENVALKNEIEETANSSVNGDLELMSSQFELDFRLFEIEMNLDMPMMAMMRGVKSIAMTVYQQAKTLILAGKYEREGMEYKLNRYKEAGRITVEEYEELIALMDARELVD